MIIDEKEFVFENTTFVIKKSKNNKYPIIVHKDIGRQVENEKELMRELGMLVTTGDNKNTHTYIEELYRILEENNITIIKKDTNLQKFEKENLK